MAVYRSDRSCERTRDDQRRARLVDQNRVHLVHNREIVVFLVNLFQIEAFMLSRR